MSDESIAAREKTVSIGASVYFWLQQFVQTHKDRSYAGYLLAGPYLLYMLVFFFVPIAYLFLVSFYTNSDVGLMKPVLTLNNYITFFTTERYLSVLLTTIEISIISTIFTIIVSYPIAYFIVFSKWAYSEVLILIVIAPMLVGNVVRAFGWFALMGSSGVLNQILGFFGLQYTLLHTKLGLILAISSVLMPFAILILMSVLYTVDRELIEAAYNLGGNRIQTFAYVTLPLSLPGVVGATLIAFVLTIGTFSTDVFIGQPQISMIGPYIYSVTNNLNWPLGAAMGFVLLAISLVLVYVYTKVVNFQHTSEGGLL